MWLKFQSKFSKFYSSEDVFIVIVITASKDINITMNLLKNTHSFFACMSFATAK